jgi:glutathione S-transferase
MMAEYTLYCFAQSGNSYKAALMLSLCGADWEPRFVDYFNGETRTPAYRGDVNVMGEVPVLVHGGMQLSQSGVILDYLSERLGRFGWDNDAERREVLRWLLFDNHKFTSYTATYRFLRTFTDQGEGDAAKFFQARMKGAFGVAEAHLGTRAYVACGRPTIADLSLCGYMFFEDEFGIDWAEYPAIGAWLERLKAMPGWAHPYDMMPGHPLPRS